MARTKRMAKAATRSGLTQTWKLWRHCCCRYGWLPLLVAPLVTVSSLLDLYATLGCEFIQINVGFKPYNSAWNESTALIGLFHYYSSDESNVMADFGINGCASFSDEFEDQFVDGDRTWEVTRIMAYISGTSGVVAMVTAWLFVFTPLPAGFFWPGVLLPTILIAFISEGSKFLFLDTAACRSDLWYPSGVDSQPQVAQSCQLGKTGYFAIAATAAFFASLIVVCIWSPKKRELDDNFGQDSLYMDGNGGELDTSLEDDQLHEIDLNLSNINHEDSFLVMQTRSGSDYASSIDEGRSFEYSYPGALENDSFFVMIHNNGDNNVEQGATFDGYGRPTMESLEIASDDNRDDGPDEVCKSPAAVDSYGALSIHLDKDARPHEGMRVVSEARLSIAEDLQSQADSVTDDLIDKCVLDLTKSFQTDELELYEPDDETDSQPGNEDELSPHPLEATAALPESVVVVQNVPKPPR